MNDFPKTINDTAEPILFADDTTILITSPNKRDFELKLTKVLNYINEWFNTNQLSINLDKTHYIKFKTHHNSRSHFEISQLNKQILPTSNIQFLGIYINDTINWKNNIEYILP